MADYAIDLLSMSRNSWNLGKSNTIHAQQFDIGNIIPQYEKIYEKALNQVYQDI